MTPSTSISHGLVHPFLPREIEREIMELAAAVYPSTRVNLQLVARRVHVWIEPIVYRALMFSQDLDPKCSRSLHLFLECIENKDPEFLHRNVHALFIEEEIISFIPEIVTSGVMTTLLSKLTGLRALLLGICQDLSNETYILMSSLPLRHLILGDSDMLNKFLLHSATSHPPSPLRKTLTHTHFSNVHDIQESFAHLEGLTHISLGADDLIGHNDDGDDNVPNFMKALLKLPSLELCQISFDADDGVNKEDVEMFLNENDLGKDERIVVVDFQRVPQGCDWKDFFLYNGLWDEGEKVLRKREEERQKAALGLQGKT